MRLLVAIPSKARADQIEKTIGKWLFSQKCDWKIFVEPQDLPAYLNVLSSDKLVNISENDQGIGYVLGKIYKYAQKHGYTHVFKIDDDTTSWKSKLFNDGRGNFSTQTFEMILKDFTEYLLEKPEKLIRINFPMTHVFMFNKQKPKKFLEENKPLFGNYVIPVELGIKIPYPNILNSEDTATFLYGTKYNYQTATYVNAGRTHRPFGTNKGGLQCFEDRPSLRLKAFEFLKKEFPKIKIYEIDNPAIKWEIDWSYYLKKN